MSRSPTKTTPEARTGKPSSSRCACAGSLSRKTAPGLGAVAGPRDCIAPVAASLRRATPRLDGNAGLRPAVCHFHVRMHLDDNGVGLSALPASTVEPGSAHGTTNDVSSLKNVSA
jgi:hypothetical protein